MRGAPNTSAGGQANPGFSRTFDAYGTFIAPRNPFRAFSLPDLERPGTPMQANIILIQPLVALLFGILILILPRLLNYLIAIYLIFIGLVGLFPQLFTFTTPT
jgi:hypothetical protein